MTKRFDRYIDENGSLKKIHMQSLCAINHLPFDKTRIFGYEQTVQVMKKMIIGAQDIEQFYRRMVFNVMARNQDDHVKNISFLMNKNGKWTLSPAYDITYMYDPLGKWTNEHQMLVNGKSSNITLEDIISAGKNMNISELIIKRIIDEVKSAVKQFEKYAYEAFLPKDIIEEIENNFVLLNENKSTKKNFENISFIIQFLKFTKIFLIDS
jgi:serine/threonine-protein kinase HipA